MEHRPHTRGRIDNEIYLLIVVSLVFLLREGLWLSWLALSNLLEYAMYITFVATLTRKDTLVVLQADDL